MKQIKNLLTIAAMLFVSHLSFAGATEDLWKALKEANYPNALTAIAMGADVKNLDPAFGTPLNLASCWADANVVKALIDAKSEIDFVAAANGFTPLMNASLWGNTEAVKLLLAAGADIKKKDKLGQPVLANAMTSAKLEIIKLLVDAGADANESYQVNKIDLKPLNTLLGTKTPQEKLVYLKTVATGLSKLGVTFPPRLADAKENDYSTLEDLTKFILEHGADPNLAVKGTWGCILNQACEFGKTGVVKALIEGKANVNMTAEYFKRTPLYMACSKGHADIVQLLVDAKANMNALTEIHIDKIWIKITPVMMASMFGYNDCVEILCKAGADINYVSVKVEHTSEMEGETKYWVKTTYKETALSLADANKHPDTVTLLKKYGGQFAKDVKKK